MEDHVARLHVPHAHLRALVARDHLVEVLVVQGRAQRLDVPTLDAPPGHLVRLGLGLELGLVGLGLGLRLGLGLG